MRFNQDILKLNGRILVVTALLCFAFSGCGGGGGENGAQKNPTSLSIGAQRNSSLVSLSKVNSVSKTLNNIELGENPVLSIFSLDGIRLQGPDIVQGFPVQITILDMLRASAQSQGVLVACLNTTTKNYRTVFKLSEKDLGTSGPLLKNGLIRTEPVDGTSTVVTTIVESELTNQLGLPVRICERLSGANQAAIAAAAEKSNSAGFAIDDLAEALQEAIKDPTSLISNVVRFVNSNIEDGKDELRSLFRTGKRADGTRVADAENQLSGVRNLSRAAMKLARQVRKAEPSGAISKEKIGDFLKVLTKINVVDSIQNIAGAEAIASALEIKNSSAGSVLTTLSNAIKTSVGNILETTANLKAAAESIATEVLTKIGGGEAIALDSGNELVSLASLIGAVLAGTTGGSAESKAAEAALIVSLNTATDGACLLGKSLEASSANTSALESVVKKGQAGGVDIAEAVTKAGSASKNTIAGLISDKFTDITILNSVKIIGSGGAIANTKVVLELESLESSEAGTYTYEWSVIGGALSNLTSSTDSIIFTPVQTGTYTITITQKLGTTVQATDEHELSVRTPGASPVILMASTSIRLRKGGDGYLSFLAFDLNSKTIPQSTIDAIGSGVSCDTPVAGLSASIDVNEGIINFTSSNITPATLVPPPYCAVLTASLNEIQATQKIDIWVLDVRPTTVTVNPVADLREGESVTVRAVALHESSATGTLRLTVSGPGSGSGTATLSGGATIITTTLINLAAGVYTVIATVGSIASDSTTFSVNKAGAPTGLSVTVDGISIGTGESLLRTVSGTFSTVDIDAIATNAISFMAWTSNVSDSNNSGQNLSLPLPLGTHLVTVSATSASGATAQVVFDVVVEQVGEVWVSHVALSGTIIGSTTIDASSNASGNQAALTTSYANGVYMVDASDVTGLDLNTVSGDMLWFNIYTESPNLDDVDGLFDIEITMTQANSIRLATLSINDATIIANGGGWDVIAESGVTSHFFTGKRENGNTAQVQVSTIATFDALFEPVTNGLKLNLLQLREAMRTIVTDNGNTGFISTFDSMSGSGITIEVSINCDNFSFTTGVGGADHFNNFKIWNITVN